MANKLLLSKGGGERSNALWPPSQSSLQEHIPWLWFRGHSPLQLCHVSLLLMQLHPQGCYLLSAESIPFRVNIPVVPLSSF